MNKRVIIGALIAVTFLLLAHRPASAMAEFCPASLNYQAVAQKAASTSPSAVYGFELTALGPRIITSANLAFDTSAGWFTVNVPAVTLAEKDRHYSDPPASYVVRDYVSPIMYVRFPQYVSIAHAWVESASAEHSAPFPWDGHGVLQCDPSPQHVVTIHTADSKPVRDKSQEESYHLDSKDADNFSAGPSAGSLILTPTSTKPPLSASCTDAFVPAMVTRQYDPGFPPDLGAYNGVTKIEIAIGADGKLLDAWVWGSSGFKRFDELALKAAVNSGYSAARAYCQPVPSRYLFGVEFDPNS